MGLSNALLKSSCSIFITLVSGILVLSSDVELVKCFIFRMEMPLFIQVIFTVEFC